MCIKLDVSYLVQQIVKFSSRSSLNTLIVLVVREVYKNLWGCFKESTRYMVEIGEIGAIFKNLFYIFFEVVLTVRRDNWYVDEELL